MRCCEEIAGLDVGDLRFDRRGLVMTVRRSKTDQEGEGRESIGVPFVANVGLSPVRAVREWLDAAAIVDGPVFRAFTMSGTLTTNRIDPDDVARLVKRLTAAAGIAGTFAGHSLRAGFITTAASTKGVSGSRHSADQRAPIGRDPARLCSARERVRGHPVIGDRRVNVESRPGGSARNRRGLPVPS